MGVDFFIAKGYWEAGLSVLPAIKNSKRPNLYAWEKYKNQLPTEQEIQNWFAASPSGCCIVCGAVSGNLETIDFDEKGIAFAPWLDKVKEDEAVSHLSNQLVIEQSPSGGYHVIYRCELPVSGNQKLAKTAESKTLIETRGEGGLFLCAPTDGYTLQQGSFQKIPTITAVERNVLLQLAKSFNQEKPKHVNTYNNSFGLPISQPLDATKPSTNFPTQMSGRPGDVFNKTGDIRELLVKHGWTQAYTSGDEERWTRPGKTFGTSATLKNIDGKDYFYVFSSNAAPLESDRSYDAFGLFTALECDGNVQKAAEELVKLGFGDKIRPPEELPNIDFSNLKINGQTIAIPTGTVPNPTPKKNATAFLNRRDPELFEPFPLDSLPPKTRNYVVEKAESLRQDPAGIAMALLTQAGAHIGASVKLRLGTDWFTTGTLWYVYIGLSGNGKSPAINGVAALSDDKKQKLYEEYLIKQKEYLQEVKMYERAKRKGEDATPPVAPTYNRVIVTDATYEGLVKAVKESGGRILLKVDELITFFSMTNRTKTPGEAQKWLSGYSGETVTTVRSTSQEIHLRDAYWSISGGSTPEKFRDFISAEGRDKDGTLSRFVMVWNPEVTEYSENDIQPKTLSEMEQVMEQLIDFQPPEGSDGRQRSQIVRLGEHAAKSWRQWKELIFYAKQNVNTDAECSFISKSQDLLPRIALILHYLQAAEEAVEAGKNTTGYVQREENGITYSDPIRIGMVIPNEIDAETWEAALVITQWIRQETFSCYRQMALIAPTSPDEGANKVLALIKDSGKEGVTMRDIGQKIKKFRGNKGYELLTPILEKEMKDGIIEKRKWKDDKSNQYVEKYFYVRQK